MQDVRPCVRGASKTCFPGYNASISCVFALSCVLGILGTALIARPVPGHVLNLQPVLGETIAAKQHAPGDRLQDHHTGACPDPAAAWFAHKSVIEMPSTEKACYALRDSLLLLRRVAPPGPLQRRTLEKRLRDLKPCLASSHMQIFWSMWLTPMSTWGARGDLFLSSLFIHHPDACLILLVLETSQGRHRAEAARDAFASVTQMGYCLVVVQTSARDLRRSRWWISDKNKRWLRAVLRQQRQTKPRLGGERPKPMQQHKHQRVDPSHVWASHLTDYLRFYLLYEFGGTYVDTDAIFVQGLPRGARELFGMDVSPTDTHPWFIDTNAHTYVAPGVMRCVRSSPIMRLALEVEFDIARYDPRCFNCVGPRALNMALLKHAFLAVKSETPLSNEGTAPTTATAYLPPRYFYPLSYDRAHLMFQPGKPMIPLFLQHAQRHSYAIHLYGHVSGRLAIDPQSGVSKLMERQRLLPARAPSSPAGLDAWAQTQQHPTLIAPRVIVVRGSSTKLAGPHAVYVRGLVGLGADNPRRLAAPPITTPVSVQISAKHGWINSCDACNKSKFASWDSAFGGLQAVNAFLANCIYHASDDTAHAADIVTVAISWQQQRRATGRPGAAAKAAPTQKVHTWADNIPVAIFHRLVTIVTHTHGRTNKIVALHASVQTWFPGTLVLASEDTNAAVPQEAPNAHASVVRWVPLPLDAGLSIARNTLVGMATTPYVQLLDDDFALDGRSHLDLLLERLILHPEVGVAGAVIPADLAQGWNFQGLMEAESGGALVLTPGSRGYSDGCARVDYVPNVFMARRSVISDVGGWDPVLKLGEHEEFFWRLKALGKRAEVVSCKFVAVQHNQFRWWENDRKPDAGTMDGSRSEQYVQSRARIHTFYAIALAKHNFSKLVVEGQVVARARL